MFITFEGGEGTGKSTQARLLVGALKAAGRQAQYTREPGGTPNAETLRELLLDRGRAWARDAEVLLHFAARIEHVVGSIRPALAGGVAVVCDRFADSTMAYQGYGLGADKATIAALTAMLPIKPDLTIILDVPEDVSAQRLAARRQTLDRYETMEPSFHTRVRLGFLHIAETYPERCVMLNAVGTASAVHQHVWSLVRSRLP